MRALRDNLTFGWLGLAALALPAPVSFLRAEGPPPAAPAVGPLEEVREGIARARAGIQSLLVEYTLTSLDPVTGNPGPVTSRHVIAARGALRFGRNVHSSESVPENLDLNRNELYFTGKTLDVFYPALGYYETSEENARLPYSWKVRGDFFFECLGWWPPQDRSRPPRSESPLYLHEALSNPGYRLHGGTHPVDGVPCRLLELAGADKLWVSPSEGYALRRREVYSAKAAQLATRYELSDHREVAPQVWVPWRVRRILYDVRKDRGTATPAVAMDTLGSVLRVEVNNVPERLFHFTPPPGTLVQNRDSGQTFQVPGGLPLLDSITAVARGRAARYARLPRKGAARNEPTWAGAALLVGVVGLAGMDLYLLCLAVRALRARGPAFDGGAGHAPRLWAAGRGCVPAARGEEITPSPHPSRGLWP
jgi:hypothetical protein